MGADPSATPRVFRARGVVAGAEEAGRRRAGRPTGTAVVEAPPGYAALGWGLLFVTALPLLLLPVAEPSLRSRGYLAVALPCLLLLVWLVRAAFLRARVVVQTDPTAGVLRLRAPLYSREVPLDALETVDVQDDDGRDHAYINWPVTGRARSRRGVRLDLGGAAALVLATHEGLRFTVVAPDRGAAAELQAFVRQAMQRRQDG